MSESAALADQGHPWLASYPEDVDWAAEIDERPLTDLLDAAIERYGDRPFLQFLGRSYSYRQVGVLVDGFARGLQELGVSKGVHVGLFLPNCPYYVIAYFAVLKAGGTVVNYNPLYAEQEIEHQIRDSNTRIMVTLDLASIYPKVGKMLERTGLERIVVARLSECLPFAKGLLFVHLRRRELAAIPDDDRHVDFGRLAATDGRPAPVAIDPRADIAVLQYTGGTTGVPKGAALTHANLYANATQLVRWYPEAALGEERILAVLPFFHVFAMSAILNFGVRTGAELVLLPRFELREVLATIKRKRPTLFPVVPSILVAINGRPKLRPQDLASLKMCISGGAPLPFEVKQNFERLTGCVVIEGYGLSEASPVVTCNPARGRYRPGSIGLPLPRTVVEIVSLDDRTTKMPAGELGELCVRGPQLMAGYWNRPEATADVLRDGRLHTGDIGHMDEDGYVFLTDRLKEVILTHGYNVYPRHVEDAIYQHEAVAEVAVIGIDDPRRGQVAKAFVVLARGRMLGAEELCAFLKDKLSPHEMPRAIEFRESLPKSAVGKILKKELIAAERARAGGGPSGAELAARKEA